jgi:RNA polymerase sigma factor (sigma-70 family)
MADTLNNEQNLIQRAKRGDVDAFNALVLHYQDRIYTVAYRLLRDREAAADIAQETFITAYRKLNTYRGGSFIGWLSRITTNRCYDELRSHQRHPTDYIEDLPGHEADDGPPLPAATPSPEQSTLENELYQAVQDCITALKADQRAVLVLSDVQGLSYQEVADATGATLGTVKSRLSRARQAVRRCLQAVQELLPTEFRLTNDP